jgi:hypothetical protein
MKKLILILSISALGTMAFGQGTVSFLNGSFALISTNATIIGGTVGPVTSSSGGFYFGLFTAPSTVTSATISDLLTPTWTFTGLYATNIAAAGRISGGASVATQRGWAPGETNSFLVAGWSSNYGHDWSTVSSLIGSGNYPLDWFGITSVSFGAAGGGTAGLPAFSLWGTTPTAQGTPLSSGFGVILIPEPSATALLVTGVLALTCRRVYCRKSRLMSIRRPSLQGCFLSDRSNQLL